MCQSFVSDTNLTRIGGRIVDTYTATYDLSLAYHGALHIKYTTCTIYANTGRFFLMKPTRCTLLLRFFSPLYMFRATMCPSSGELTVSMRHWYFSLCMGGCETQ